MSYCRMSMSPSPSVSAAPRIALPSGRVRSSVAGASVVEAGTATFSGAAQVVGFWAAVSVPDMM